MERLSSQSEPTPDVELTSQWTRVDTDYIRDDENKVVGCWFRYLGPDGEAIHRELSFDDDRAPNLYGLSMVWDFLYDGSELVAVKAGGEIYPLS